MPELNWHVILTGLLYAVLTGVFNLIFSRKTQIEEWCAANPRLAALGMFMRSVGFDPHNLWAFATLFITKKLPAIKIADSAVVREEVRKLEAKANKKDPPDDPDTTVSLMPDPVRMVAEDRSRLHNDKPDEPAEMSDKWRAPDWRLQTAFGALLACALGCSSLPLTAKRCDFTNPEYSAHVAKCRHDIETTCLLDDDSRPRKDCPALVACQEWRVKECQ